MIGGVTFPDYVILHHHSFAGEAEQPLDYEEVTGFHVGVTGDVELYRNLYFNGTLLFGKRGFNEREGSLALGMSTQRYANCT